MLANLGGEGGYIVASELPDGQSTSEVRMQSMDSCLVLTVYYHAVKPGLTACA